MAIHFGVLGGGTWGMVMAAHLRLAGHTVAVWHFIAAEADEMDRTRSQPFLKDFVIPAGIKVTADVETVVKNAEILVMAVPSQIVRNVMVNIKPYLGERSILNLSKGIERKSLLRMSEVIGAASGMPSDRIATVYGPSHAEEVAAQVPTTLVAASTNMDFARELQKLISTPDLRVYASSDIVGVELGGSVKNVIAIAGGICVGIGFGDNTMAALMTRGLAEITRLGISLGAEPNTFAGLSGVGDLAVTVYSKHSRNRYLGEQIGKGRKYQEVLESMGMVAEGVYTAESVLDLAARQAVDMPICQEVSNVLFNKKNPQAAIVDLMTRGLRDETVA